MPISSSSPQSQDAAPRKSQDPSPDKDEAQQDDKPQEDSKTKGDGEQKNNAEEGGGESQDDAGTQASNSEAVWWRVAAAEVFGTFVLTFVICCMLVVTEVGKNSSQFEKNDYTARTVLPGLLIVGLIYAIGDVSGAHINPAATWAFVLRGTLPWRRIPLYWISQMVGAIGAVLMLRALFSPVKKLGVSEPHIAAAPAVAFEAMLTGLLIFVILNTARRHSSLGPQSALAVGSTVAACSLLGAPVTGASMNPARSLGPVIVTGDWAQSWIYVVGPFVGATLAAALTWLLHGAPAPEEAKPASGDEESSG